MASRLQPNPFNNGIMPDAWAQPVVDVPSIHGEVTDLSLELLDEVARQRKRRSILVHGVAGSGKTHTLSRLRAAAAGRIVPTPIFSYIRLTTSPNMIRRHLRQGLVRDLVRKGTNGVPMLETLLLESLAKETGTRPDKAEMERFCEMPARGGLLRTAFEETSVRLGLDYHVACACRLFLLRRHRHAVVHWLETGDLPDDVREHLGCELGSPAEEKADPEHVAFGVTLQLTKLATDTRPLVLCFDQLEAMQVTADDAAGYFAFGKLAADLFDHCQALLLVTCVQTAAVPLLTESIPAHDFHRLAQHEQVLAPLTESQARELIRARLDTSAALRLDPRRRLNPLWPIGEARFRRFLAVDPTPRRLCALGREAFAAAHRMPAGIQDYLSVLFEQRRGAPMESSGMESNVVHGLALMLAARGGEVATPDDREDVDLVLELPGRRILISVCNEDGGTLAHRLEQISDRPPTGSEERVVVRESRRPISPKSKKAWEQWRRLASDPAVTGEGFRRVRTVAPTTDAIAALEAIRSIMSDSRSGDLEVHGESVPPEIVTTWIRQHLEVDGLQELLAAIGLEAGRATVAVGASHGELRDAALEILQHRHVMLIDDLAAAARCGVEEMRLILAADADAFGTLGVPPLVVFDRSLALS
jgi:hypothetical protein